jgi:hypothetical protein
MLGPDYLREQAERCFRLASGVVGTTLAGELEALGRKFEDEAEDLDAAMRSGSASGAGGNCSDNRSMVRQNDLTRRPVAVKGV